MTRHHVLLRTPVECARSWVVALDERLFAEDDLAATARGWQITRPRLLVRVYRDPRWDRVDRVDRAPIPPSAGRAR
jgi:hypothetical protein